MLFIRAVLTALIAVSVAMLPATGGAAVSAKPVEMSMADHAAVPCCPCCNEQDRSKSSIACALKCINFAGAVLPTMAVGPSFAVGAALPPMVDRALHDHVRSPPTHPPPA
jgi:hypothetical protein